LRELRPTLYLAQQSQLLAGNISIILGARGACRTYKGEEVAGAQAVQDAARRIESGEVDVVLAGGACNAERWDQLLILELGARLWRGAYRPLWGRACEGGGMILGSMGAFLVLEASPHARARGARPYARIAAVDVAPSALDDNSAAERLRGFVRRHGCAGGHLPVMSGATGFEGPERLTTREKMRIGSLEADGIEPIIRAHGGILGHGLEAHFPAGVALAALALRDGRFYPPFDPGGFECPMSDDIEKVLVTGHGNLSGEAVALVEDVKG
jgi:3-oxoacyl-[acyl-carrier-protein] synthase II